MNADSSSGNPSGKRASPPGWAASIFQLLRLFWLTVLAWLIVVLYGLNAGWSTHPQWSNGFFIAAFAQVIIAASMVIQPGEDFSSFTVRYVANGDIDQTRRQMVLESLRKQKFGVRAFIGALLTGLISAGFLLQ